VTAPTSLSVVPAPARAGSVARSSSAGTAPAFASALDDALTSGRSPQQAGAPTPGPGRDTDEDTGAHDPATDPGTPADAAQGGTAPATPGVVSPGLWALLAAAAPLTTDASSHATTAAAELIGAVTGVAAGPAAAPATALPGTPHLPDQPPATAPAPPAATPVPAGPTGTAGAAASPAGGTGPTVVLDPTSLPTAVPPATAVPAPVTGPLAGASRDVPVLFATASATDTPDTGSGDSSDGAPVTLASTTQTAAPAGSVVPLTGPAPAVPGTPAPAAAIPAGGTPVAEQLAPQLAVLRHAPDGSSTMTVVITPESLGEVTVAVTVTDGTLDVRLHGAQEAGRHALTEALPELRRELERAGLTFDKLEVATDPDAGAGARSAQQQLLDARTGQQGSSGRPGQADARPRPWGSSPDPLGAGSAALTTDQSASAGVDVRV
jgi:flagellar hook-length control protein FliK